MLENQCIKVWVSGRVQGVFFRDSTREQASRLGIRGYAINLEDGRVEVLACGGREALDSLLEWLKEGPRMARVSRLQSEPVTVEVPPGFHIG